MFRWDGHRRTDITKLMSLFEILPRWVRQYCDQRYSERKVRKYSNSRQWNEVVGNPVKLTEYLKLDFTGRFVSRAYEYYYIKATFIFKKKCSVGLLSRIIQEKMHQLQFYLLRSVVPGGRRQNVTLPAITVQVTRSWPSS
jgi:hypothetical protein